MSIIEDDSRREFEAWVGAEPYTKDTRRYPDDPKYTQWLGQYRDITTQLAWEAWEESRRRIEEKSR